MTGGRRILQETTHQTDAQGGYHFTIPREQLAERRFGMVIDVKHPDYPAETNYCYDFSNTLRLKAFGERISNCFDVELQHGEPITGEVVAPDGTPVAGVLVHSFSYSVPDGQPTYLVMGSVDEVRTDVRGRFRLVVVTPGKATLSLFPERYAVSEHVVEDNKRGDLGRFVLREGVSIKGRVVDAAGVPLRGVTVNAVGFVKPPADESDPAFHWDRNQAGSLSRSAVTDAKGDFVTGPMPSAVYGVVPVETDNDPLLGETFQHLPAPFVMRKVTVEEGKAPEPLELRALPSVVVEAHFRDSQGRPANGQNFQLMGQLAQQNRGPDPLEPLELPGSDTFWLSQSWPDAEGKVVWHIPRGLASAQISLDTFMEERHALRYRIGTDGALCTSGYLPLGTLDHDVKDIEMVRFESPTVLVKVVDRQGSRPRGIRVTAQYAEHPVAGPTPGADADGPALRLAEQADGRFRSMHLLPDQKLTIEATADGYRQRSTTLELPEGAVRELELVLDKR